MKINWSLLLHLGHQLLHDLTMYKQALERRGRGGEIHVKSRRQKDWDGKYSRGKEAQTGQLFWAKILREKYFREDTSGEACKMPDLVLASVSCSRDSSHSLPLICCDPLLLVYKRKKRTKDLPENANTPSRQHSNNMYFSILPKSKARRNETHGLVRGEFEDNYQIRTRTSSLHL